MGSRIIALARADQRFTVVHELDRDDASTALRAAEDQIDAVIDFSSDDGAPHAAAIAESARAALLVGTTGLSRATFDTLRGSANLVPVMIAPNTSLGVAVLRHLVAVAARMLGEDYDVDLIDIHHNQKKDAPSGTALRLAEALRERGGRELPDERILSIRAGDIVGEHTMQFAGPGEWLRLTHSATNRDVFARGALRAARWLSEQKPGLYSIEDSLPFDSDT